MEALAKKLEGKKGKFFAIKADLTQEQDILNAFKWVKQNLGPISVLINNAGRIELTTLIDGDTNAWKTTVDLNVIGLCIATREAVRDMRKNNIDGHIVHINSVGGHQVPPLPNINIYPATKFAVTALTETLRNELNSIGSKIKITSISPGAVQTEMAQNAINNPEIPKELLKKLKDMAFLKPADIADSTIYVLSTPPHVQVHELTVITVNQPSL